MQSLINRYTRVILDALQNGSSKQFAEQLVAYMKARGHSSLLPAVMRRVEREAAQNSSGVVTLARADDAEKFASNIAASLENLQTTAAGYRVRVDPALVGGYSVRANGKLVDRSYRTALVNLYQRITE